jgi:Ca2+-binding EF-hand superfamily protein
VITGVTGLNVPSCCPGIQSARQQKPDIFNRIDTNQDGSIDKAELTSFVEKISHRSEDPVNIDQLFSQIDTDGDGVISPAEAQAYGAKMAANRPNLFDRIDTNQGGSIDKAEFKAFMARRHSHSKDASSQQAASSSATPVSADTADALFDAIDTDGNGVITKEEMDAFAEKIHEQLKARSLSPLTNLSVDTTSSTSSGTAPTGNTLSQVQPTQPDQGSEQLPSINLLG